VNAIASAVPCAATLTERDVEMFARIGVPLDLLEAARVEHVSDADARERFGIQGPASKDMAGIVFPYHSHVTERRVTARVRRDNPEIEDGRPKNKYVSAYGDRRHLYFSPDAWEKLQNPSTIIVLVEAEKSSLALTAWARRTGTDLLAVGLGGCWGWRGRIGKAEGIDGSRVDVTGAIPDLSVCDGRTVHVCMDANAATNGILTNAPYSFRFGASIQQNTAPLAIWAGRSGIKSVYNVTSDYAPGIESDKVFSSVFISNGGGKVLGDLYVPVTANDFTSYMQRVKDAKPEANFAFVVAGSPSIAF